ncbi:1-deoxy-D-xylulose-5-phosphate reductoisomerase [Candidatus Nitrosacidococcus sp. I8]|uniref:1-deoxy-D-xylulose-5-phosphate reductoisomerase n=1 Tax=Candidatus Nitrosacidococcus sp. I8 TaxID=2942908 RepID=UPI002226CAC8|nr:1-deoxy-D-xylulose-5-phosphate reductoisomerase [Candidatus Nitrosacidococcus sp. I8]CAH9017463.1 1-deoxy-D-xylulose 5-phosphate reductoisomerase [Candidatus Nitrosacidococcus sp. I8]
MIGVSILGSTGSIGISTLDVLARYPDRYRVEALSANNSVEKLYQQCLKFCPTKAVMVNPDAAEQLHQKLAKIAPEIEVEAGSHKLEEIASSPKTHYVMAAIVGAAGLLPTLAAAQAGKRVLLANKESLVMSGQLFINAVERNSAELIPIDSEHNAIWQCIPQRSGSIEQKGICRILLTASGGPFRNKKPSELETVTPDEACAHPNWDMGRKISVDSASMMNKGLEVIEAHWLFGATAEQIEVVIHPESVIHSMVDYADGSVLAQLGNPDMRTPIANGLAWPDRMASGVMPLDLFKIGKLTFYPPDFKQFPCLDLAYTALKKGGTCSTILNAANEVAVQAFLDHQIPFTYIPRLIEWALGEITSTTAESVDTILTSDTLTRQKVEEQIYRWK